MPKKVAAKKTKEVVVKQEESKTSFFDYFRFGESYTSLILGIVAVIIATVLLLSFVHNKNVSSRSTQSEITPNQQNIASLPSNTIVPSAAVSVTTVVTETVTPTIKVTSIPTQKPTVVPTVVKKPAVTTAPKKIAKIVITPTKKVVPTKEAKKEIAKSNKKVDQSKQIGSSGSHSKQYIVVAGDNLWTIAEREYKSGYNWVDISRANNLNNPGDIHKGDKLIIPSVSPKLATVSVTPEPTKTIASNQTKGGLSITNNSYTIVRGDNLWSIAVRAYGDGYQWVKIARANNLNNPGLIHAGNTIKIPRNA